MNGPLRKMPERMYINFTCPNCHTPVNFEVDLGDFPKIIVEPCPECACDVTYDHPNGQEFYESMCDATYAKLNEGVSYVR